MYYLTGKMAQRLRPLAALTDQIPAPSWDLWLTTACNSNPRRSCAQFWTPWALYAHGTHTDKHIHITKLKILNIKIT